MGDRIYHAFTSKFWMEILCKNQQLAMNSDMNTVWPCFYSQKRRKKYDLLLFQRSHIFMYNLDLKCITKETIPNCIIWARRHTFAIWKSTLDPRLSLSWPHAELKTMNEVRAVIFCFLFQERSISWILLGAVFSWQQMCSLLVCMKKKKNTPNNYTCIQLFMYFFPSVFALETMKHSSFVWQTSVNA